MQTINTSCFDVMDTLIYVTLHKSYSSVSSSLVKHSTASTGSLSTLSSGIAHSVLVKLLSCLQTSFLAWINAMKNSGNEELDNKARSLLQSCECSPIQVVVVVVTLVAGARQFQSGIGRESRTLVTVVMIVTL